MRCFAQLLLVSCLVAWPVAAQRGRGGGGFHGGMGGGFRGGMGGGFRGGWGGGFRGGWGGGFRGGNWGRFNRFNGFRGRNRFFGFGYYPWGYWGGWGYPYASYPYYDSYSYPNYGSYSYPTASSYNGYASAPSVVIIQSQPATPSQPVIVESVPQEAAPQQTSEYNQQRNDDPIYLLAFKGQSNICAAEAYWIAGSTLHYVTLQHVQRQAPLDTVDRATTLQLNRQRGVSIRLSNTE